MLSVEDAVREVRSRGEKHWVSWALGRGSWPLRINLDAPRGERFDRELAAAQLWSGSWEEALRRGLPGVVMTVPRRARGLGSYMLPTTWVLDNPEIAVDQFLETKRRYLRARERFSAAVDMPETVWENIDDIPLKVARLIADLSDSDWVSAVAVLTHIAAGTGGATMLRQLAVPGVHTKWIEDNAALIAAMLGVPPGDGDPKSRLEAHIGLLVEKPLIPVYLACPQLRATAAGMNRFAAPVETLNASALAPTALLIIENRKFGSSFNFDFEGLAVVYGLGGGAPSVAALRWAAEVDTVVYWGDIDRAGLAILASLRRAGVNARSVLMDADTWDRHSTLVHDSIRDQARSDNEIPTELEESERRVYEFLNAEYCGGRELQLEQEHIPLPEALAAIQEEVYRSSVRAPFVT